MKNKKQASIVVLIASLLVAVIFMNTWIIFRMTANQTIESGMYQLESISGKLQGTISDAENLTLELALEAREYLKDKALLEKFLYEKKEQIKKYHQVDKMFIKNMNDNIRNKKLSGWKKAVKATLEFK